MTRRDDTVLLRQMRDYAIHALNFSAGRDRTDLEVDLQLSFALTHAVEIVGEAARQVSEQTQEMYPQIPWSNIIGMRHRLAHGYDRVSYDILWETVVNNLPPLVQELDDILSGE